MKIRVRYEYRTASPNEADESALSPHVHDDTQEGLYLLLGDFLREYGLEYPQGSPVVRFALSNTGERTIYLNAIRLVLRTGRLFGDRLVLDPVEDRVLPFELAEGVNVLRSEGGKAPPVELIPGDSVGYRFELFRLANTLKREGYEGNLELVLEATDRLGNAYGCPFNIGTDLWAYPRG